MHFVQVNTVSRQEEGAFVLQQTSFTLAPLQKLAIAGATGSGKTTLLRIMAGLVQPYSGTVWFEGERVYGPEEKLLPGHPGIAYLSQHFELRNNYRVAELLQMAAKLSKDEADVIYQVCRIDHLLQRWTHQLSGGEKQRIALARLLVSAPRLLLLDEPWSNLDAIHKTILKSVIQAIGDDLKITCLLVSHDPVDVLSWADEIFVMQEGAIIQHGTPQQVYHQPVSEYAAALFGKFNVLRPALAKALSQFADIEMQQINNFIRPEQFRIAAGEGDGIKAVVQHCRFMGSYYELEVAAAGSHVIVNSGTGAYAPGTAVYLTLVS